MADLDEFGIKKIYSDNKNPDRAKPWLMGKNDWETRQSDWDGDITSHTENCPHGPCTVLNIKRYGGSHPGRGRNPVLAISPPPEEVIFMETDQSVLPNRGYMWTPADWKNVEITLHVRVNDVDFAQARPEIALAARGSATHDHTPPFTNRCTGVAYYAVLKVDGSPALAKELFHDSGGYAQDEGGPVYPDNPNPPVLLDPIGEREPRWIGIKGIFYNNMNGNPVLELWLDERCDNSWLRAVGFEDSGGWTIKNNINHCGGKTDEKITWGGPVIIFRWDALLDLDIRYASVREIVPPEVSLTTVFKGQRIPAPIGIRNVAQNLGISSPISIRALVARLL